MSAFAQDDVPSLIKQLKDNDNNVRLKAIDALGMTPDQATDAMAALTDLYLTDPDESVRRRARTVLGQIRLATRKNSALPPGHDANSAPNGQDTPPPPPPEKPKGRVAELIKQLKSNPADSMKASDELKKLGAEAMPACAALVEVMMMGKNAQWHDAGLAAAEALEKINPKLQAIVLKILLAPPPADGITSQTMTAIRDMGPAGYGAMPLLKYFWSLDPALGLHVNGDVLVAMHFVAPADKAVTDEMIGVLTGKVVGGQNVFLWCLNNVEKRGLTDQQLTEAYLKVLAGNAHNGTGPLGALTKLRAMAHDGKVKAEALVKPFAAATASNHETLRTESILALGELGPAAKDAIPLLRRFKLEHPDEKTRKAAASALIAIEK